MKNFILLLLMTTCIFLNAQTTVWSDDFKDKDISDWTLIDEDGDGKNWKVDVSYEIQGGKDVEIQSLTSFSVGEGTGGGWDDTGVALTPNNYAISPKIDLSSASGNTVLKWKAAPTVPESYDNEFYAVYVATSKDVTKLLASPTKTGKISLKGVKKLEEKTLDLSSFNGKSEVYVAFRHYDSTNQDGVRVSEVSVAYGVAASTEDLVLDNVAYFYNSKTNKLVIKSNESLDNLNVFNTSGKKILSKKLSSNFEKIDVSTLANGVYIAKVSAKGKFKTFKFIK